MNERIYFCEEFCKYKEKGDRKLEYTRNQMQ